MQSQAMQNPIVTNYSAQMERIMPSVPKPNSQGSQGSQGSLSIPMTFNVQGLDLDTFKRKMIEAKPDIEGIIMRVMNDVQHQKKRVSFAD